MLERPLYDDTRKIQMPLATAALIAACSLVFFGQTGLPPAGRGKGYLQLRHDSGGALW
jgi:hypothetical protein